MSLCMFEHLTERGADAADGFELEASIHIVPSKSLMIPGVNIQVGGMDSPLFISTEELRILADQTDIKINEWHSKQHA